MGRLASLHLLSEDCRGAIVSAVPRGCRIVDAIAGFGSDRLCGMKSPTVLKKDSDVADSIF